MLQKQGNTYLRQNVAVEPGPCQQRARTNKEKQKVKQNTKHALSFKCDTKMKLKPN